MTINLKYSLLFCVFLANTLSVIASNSQQKKADSLLEVATNNTFKNPDKTIEIAISVFNDESYSLKTRTIALMKVSLGYNSKRDYKKALEYIIKAKEFSSKINDKKLQIEILFNIGVQYHQQKTFDKALEYMEDIEKRCLNYPVQDSVRKILADSYLVKGFIYKNNLNCDIALEYFNKGIKEYERLGTDIYNRSIGYYNKGNCYISLSQYSNAKESFNKSIQLAQLKNANSLVSFAEKGMAEVYTLEGKHKEAILLLKSAQEKSKNVGDLILNSEIYKGLFENNLVLNNWDDYHKYYELFLKTQLEIKKSQRNSISASIKENSKKLNADLNSIQSKFNTIFYLIILILLIFIILVFVLQIKNKKTLKTLQKKIETNQNANPLIETR